MARNSLLGCPPTLLYMGKFPINDVLAQNLKHFMNEKRYTQASLAAKAGIAQRTIGNYLKPELRQAESKSGKAPSAKLTELEKLCEVLGIEVWELLRPLTPTERKFYAQIENSFNQLRSMAPKMEQERAEQQPVTHSDQEHPEGSGVLSHGN